MTPMPEPLGFVGLGIMGGAMAGHLRAAGHPLFVHTRTRAKAEPLLAAGATWCDSPADVAGACQTLLLCVTDTPDVERVLFGPQGAAGRLATGGVVVDFSTISPAAARDFAGRLVGRGVALLDAPVTGGDVGARQATLTIMVGGPADVFERVRPILERVGKKIVHVGPSGAGQTLKACNQILCALNILGVAEALMLAERSGLDANVLIDTLSTGAGGSWALENLGRRIARGDLAPGFMIKLQQKDLRIVQGAAEALHLPLPGTALAQQLFRAVEAEPGGGELGTQAIVRAIAKMGQ